MKRLVAVIVVAASVVLGAFPSADATTLDDAKAMVEKAYTYFMENGKKDTLAEFSNPYGQFVKGDLYVLVLDFNGLVLADGGNPGLIGVNISRLKDTKGRYFVQQMIETAMTKDSGWIEYEWLNRATNKIQPKSGYVKRIKGMDAFIVSGVLL